MVLVILMFILNGRCGSVPRNKVDCIRRYALKKG